MRGAAPKERDGLQIASIRITRRIECDVAKLRRAYGPKLLSEQVDELTIVSRVHTSFSLSLLE